MTVTLHYWKEENGLEEDMVQPGDLEFTIYAREYTVNGTSDQNVANAAALQQHHNYCNDVHYRSVE